MILNSTPVLATSIKAFVRSVLFSLGVDHALMDFWRTRHGSRHCVAGVVLRRRPHPSPLQDRNALHLPLNRSPVTFLEIPECASRARPRITVPFKFYCFVPI